MDRGQVLIALTTERGIASELFILPKGGVKRGETLDSAAQREIEEEAGFTGLSLLGELGSRQRLDYRKTKWITTHYFLYYTEQRESKPTDTRRDYESRWFPLTALPALFWPEQRELIESHRDRIEAAARAAASGTKAIDR